MEQLPEEKFFTIRPKYQLIPLTSKNIVYSNLISAFTKICALQVGIVGIKSVF